MPEQPQSRRWLWIALAALGLIGVGAAGSAVAIIRAPAPGLNTWQWWLDFFKSPGFGGAGALIAAGVTAAVLMARAQIDRDIATKARDADRDAARELREATIADAAATRWWETFKWARDHMDEMEFSSATLLLRQLNEQAPTDADRALVLSATDLLTTLAKGGPDVPVQRGEGGPGAVTADRSAPHGRERRRGHRARLLARQAERRGRDRPSTGDQAGAL